MFQTEQRVKTIKDLYDYAVENNEELLGNWQSSATDDFWLGYVLENTLYDRFFCSRYKNWYYFDQTGDETVAEVFQNFVNAVTDFLTLNDKRFSEMFKVEQLTITSDMIYQDYFSHRETDSERTLDREYVSGEREDSTVDDIGSREDTVTGKVMAFNSSTFQDANKSEDYIGPQSNTSRLTKGQQTDGEDVTDTYGSESYVQGANNNPFENMQKFLKVWNGYSFYSMVFREIAKELLLV